MCRPLDHEDTTLFKTTGNKKTDNLTLLPLVRKSSMSCKSSTIERNTSVKSVSLKYSEKNGQNSV